MNYYFTAKNLKISDIASLNIKRKVAKIKSMLSNLAEDIPVLNVGVKLHKNSLYRIKLILSLPKDVLVVKVHSHILGKGMKGGFDRLIEQLKNYREVHFKNLSKYPRNDSIRRTDYNLGMFNFLE